MNNLVSWLNDLFIAYPIFVMVVAGISFLAFFIFTIYGFSELGKMYRAHKKRKQFEKDKSAEFERICALPRLRTDFLLKVEGEFHPDSARTYGSRYDRLKIFDEYGQMFLGLKTPEILEDLIAGEFILKDYWIPFCGPGEMYISEPVEIDGFHMDLFPILLNRKPTHLPEWLQWLKIEQNDARNHEAKRRVQVPENFWDLQKTFEKRRGQFGSLALEA